MFFLRCRWILFFPAWCVEYWHVFMRSTLKFWSFWWVQKRNSSTYRATSCSPEFPLPAYISKSGQCDISGLRSHIVIVCCLMSTSSSNHDWTKFYFIRLYMLGNLKKIALQISSCNVAASSSRNTAAGFLALEDKIKLN